MVNGKNNKPEIELIGKDESIEAYKNRNVQSKWAKIFSEFVESKKPAMRIKNKMLGQFKSYKAKYPQLQFFGRGKDTFVVNKEVVDLDKTWVSDLEK